MAFENVRPGEIISAELMNFILGKLRELEDRLDAGSGQPSGVRIDNFDPPDEIAVGQFLRVFGSNFAFPGPENIIEIDGELVTEFGAPNTSTLLTFRVPLTVEVENEEGDPLEITITNEEFGSVEATYTFLPPLPVTGPPPVIDTVTRIDGSTTLNTGQEAIITGENFAPESQDNIITFTVSDGAGGFVTYPLEGEELEIEMIDDNTIQVVVPDIVEIPAGQQRPVVLELTVEAQTASRPGVMVRRS